MFHLTSRLAGLRRKLGPKRGFFRNRRGNVAVVFAFALPAMIGFCGMGGEATYWYFKGRDLQVAADLAAFDGAVVLKGGGASAAITTAATTGATSNGWTSSGNSITVNSPPVSGTHKNASSVEVLLTESIPRYFTAIFTSTPVTLSARAVATTASGGQACILALDGTANNTINLSGSADIDSPNCDVVSDSTSSQSISMSGSANITASCVVSAGGISTSGSASITLKKCTSNTTNAAKVADPYSAVAAPPIVGSCLNGNYSSAATLSQGYYCNGINISSTTATFNSGIYYVNGNFNISGSSIVSGANVIFYVTNGSVNISGQSQDTFSAPTSGTYSGIVFFGSRSGNSGTNNQFSGQSSSSITGALYFPTEGINFSGGSSGSSNCTQIIADNVTISGQANLDDSCTGVGTSSINVADGAAGSVKIVE